jgi:hypothetical protein
MPYVMLKKNGKNPGAFLSGILWSEEDVDNLRARLHSGESYTFLSPVTMRTVKLGGGAKPRSRKK